MVFFLSPFSRHRDPVSERALRVWPDSARGDGSQGENPCWGRGGRRGRACSRLCLHQGSLEGDACGMEPRGPGDTEAQGDLEETPMVGGLGPDTQDLEDQSPPNSLPSSAKTGESLPCHYPSRRHPCWAQALGLSGLVPSISLTPPPLPPGAGNSCRSLM